MPQIFSNNARALLTSGIGASATSLTVQSAKADLFPIADVGASSLPSADDWFKVVLQDSSGNVEIVYVRTRASGSPIFSNVIRGQEGTTARAFDAGSVVGLRVTALDLQNSISAAEEVSASAVKLTGDQVISGVKRFSSGVRVGPDNDVSFYYDTDQSAAYIQTGELGSYQFFRFSESGDFTAPGNVTAYSDIRLKRDLHVIPHALDKVSRLTGYTYTRVDTGERQTGLVAQDVQRVLPEAVVGGEHLSVAYGNLMGLLVEAVKELKAEVEKLKGA